MTTKPSVDDSAIEFTERSLEDAQDATPDEASDIRFHIRQARQLLDAYREGVGDDA